jgi:hypothetical protein
VYVLYSERVIIFRLILDSPMSPTVETAVGAIRDLVVSFGPFQEGVSSRILLTRRPLWRSKLPRPYQTYRRRQRELYEHMAKRHKQRVGKVVVFRREHPLIIQR